MSVVVPSTATMSVVVPSTATVFVVVSGKSTVAVVVPGKAAVSVVVRLGGLWLQCFMCDPRPFFLKNLPQKMHGS